MAVSLYNPTEDADMYPSMERGKLLEALGALRKVFLVAGKAFDVVDILGKPDERREAMRALHNEAIALTDDLDNVEDLEAVWVKLDVLLIRMASTASANSIADQPKGTGFRPASHFATNDEQGKYGLSIDKSWTDEAKAATAPMLSDEQMQTMGIADVTICAFGPSPKLGAPMSAKDVRWFYQKLIASGELIRRDQLEADTEVGIDCGHHFRYFSIGRHKYSKKIPEAEYNELLRRGAKIVEG
jgi:hypothetical protein